MDDDPGIFIGALEHDACNLEAIVSQLYHFNFTRAQDINNVIYVFFSD